MRTLGAIIGTAALVGTVLVGTTGSAQASPSTAGAADGRAVHVYEFPHFSSASVNSWLYGVDDECSYVGDGWNDDIRSARTEGSHVVELWEHFDCTGISIVVDRTGYGNIGPWVSAIRPRF